MKRNLIVALITIFLAGASAVIYRSVRTKPDGAASARSAVAPMIASHDSVLTDREHELKALESDLAKNPDHVPILVRMAQVSRELGNLKDSVRYLQEAVQQDPKHEEALLELGRALYETGDVGGAIRETEKLSKLNPSNVDALYNLGAIYANLSQDERARVYWEQAASLGPDTDSGRRAKDSLKQLQR